MYKQEFNFNILNIMSYPRKKYVEINTTYIVQSNNQQQIATRGQIKREEIN